MKRVCIVLGYSLEKSEIKLNTDNKIDFTTSHLSYNVSTRVHLLVDYLQSLPAQESAVVILSGKGKCQFTEANVMNQYLKFLQNKSGKDLSAKIAHCELEEKSLTTFYNAYFSMPLIAKIINNSKIENEEPSNMEITILTNFYHARRGFILLSYFKAILEAETGMKVHFKITTAPNRPEIATDFQEPIMHAKIIKDFLEKKVGLIEQNFELLGLTNVGNSMSVLEMATQVHLARKKEYEEL